MTKMTRLAVAARRRVRGEEDPEQGFTLIELLVVLLIIGILLAIAIPTFLSVTKSANDTAAQSNLQTALTGAKTYYTEQSQSYLGMYPGFASIDTGLSQVTSGTGSNGPHVVSIDVKSSSLVYMAAFASGNNNCWVVADSTASQTVWGVANYTGTLYGELKNATSTTCNAAAFATATPAGGVSQTGFSSI